MFFLVCIRLSPWVLYKLYILQKEYTRTEMHKPDSTRSASIKIIWKMDLIFIALKHTHSRTQIFT